MPLVEICPNMLSDQSWREQAQIVIEKVILPVGLSYIGLLAGFEVSGRLQGVTGLGRAMHENIMSTIREKVRDIIKRID